MTKNVSKKLVTVLLALVAAITLCFGVIGLSQAAKNANAETEVVYENTYLTGFRAKNNAGQMHFYWRIDGASLGYKATDVLAKVAVDYTSGGVTTQRNIELKYTTASTQGATGNLGGTSDRRKGDCATNHPCIYIDINNPKAVNGDKFTIPKGTVLDNKYILTQDYTVEFNGTNWLLSDDSAIPVELSGFKNGNAKTIYVFGLKELYSYYVKDVFLNQSVTVDCYDAQGNKSEISGVKLQKTNVSSGKAADVAALIVTLPADRAVGDKIVLKKGTKFDNCVFARDYEMTQISAGQWSVVPVAEENDEVINLSKRGGNATTLNIYYDKSITLDYIADEQISVNAKLYKNNEPVYCTILSLAPEQHTLSVRVTVSEGDIIKVPAGFVVAGYKTNKDYMFKWDGSAWSEVTCDGVNHKYADEHTCHDRTCACGHVEPASTDHVFAEGTHVCNDRVCTVCGDTVKGVGHTWVGDTCEKTCSVCGATDGVHEWDDGEVTVPASCTAEGVMTYKCTKCTATKTEPIAKSDHTFEDGSKKCSKCGYRIPYTADDMSEILASGKLTKYTYSDFHVNYEMSEMGHIYNEYTDGIKYGNTYLLNTVRLGEKSYKYEEGHENYADMMVGFSLNVSAWAASGRSGYVYLAAHENGNWGIGFMFSLVEGNPNLRFVYRSGDAGSQRSEFVASQTLDMELNKTYYFELGVIKNDDGSIFAFALKDGELFMSGTLTTRILESMKCEENHDGIGGAASIVFNGSATVPSVAATICDREHKYPAEMHACKDYKCEICGTVKTHTADHKWGDGTVKEEGNCTKEDIMVKVCAECGEEAEYKGNFRHDWDKENKEIITPRSCNGVDEVVKYKCKHCDAEYEETLVGTGIEGPHEYETITIKEATCVEEGIEKEVCSKCHNEHAETPVPVDENNHKHVTAVSGKAATCTENGEKDHFVCSDCNKKLVKDGDAYVPVTDEELVINAHGHDFENGVCKNCDAVDPDYVAPVKESGCLSGVNTLAVLFPLLVVAFVIFRKKQRTSKQ